MSKHPVPISILDQHTIALGKTGAGKSFALRSLVEMLLDSGKRVCVIDPKGDWWGIKSSADGKSPGYGLVIFGGDHADIPINPRVGKEVAELVATGNRPCVIDFRGWMPGERTRFWIDFASTLFKLNRAPLWLVIDEVHNFAPQGKVMDPEAGKSLHWTNRIASEGRGLGIRLLMASQRPQKVHKDTVTCAETLIAMRVIHKLDRDAMKDWIDGAGDPDRAKMVLNSLAEMKRGEAFVWHPEQKFFEQLKFPPIKTFDSFKAPTGDEKTLSPKGWANVNLDDVKSRLASAVEEAKANDPAELKKQILELRKQLGQKPGTVKTTVDERATERAVMAEQKQWHKLIADQQKKYENAVRPYRMAIENALKSLSSVKGVTVTLPSIPKIIQPTPIQQRIVIQPKKQAESVNGELTNPEQRILDAIAWLGSLGIEEPEQPAVAFLAGYRFGGGAFNNPRGSLRVKGLVEYIGSNKIKFTQDGSSFANHPETALTNSELHEKVMARLPGPEQKLLKPLIEAYPESMSNEELSEASGYANGSGGYNNPRGRLRTLGLIEYHGGGYVKAKQLLFPENQ
jgi:hypothetical protein